MAKPSTSLLKRRLDIAEIVRKNGEIKVDDLAEMLAVSGVTIRNDLNYLEQQGYLKRSFGGAIYTAQPVRASVTQDMSLVQEWDRSAELELAKQVARLVADEDSLFLGAGVVPRKGSLFLANLVSCVWRSTISAMWLLRVIILTARLCCWGGLWTVADRDWKAKLLCNRSSVFSQPVA